MLVRINLLIFVLKHAEGKIYNNIPSKLVFKDNIIKAWFEIPIPC